MFFSVHNIWESLGRPENWNSCSASRHGAVWENLRSQKLSDCLQEVREHDNCVPARSCRDQIWNDETKIPSKLWSRWLIRKLLPRGTCDRRHSLTFLCRPPKFLLHPQRLQGPTIKRVVGLVCLVKISLHYPPPPFGVSQPHANPSMCSRRGVMTMSIS